MRRRGFVFLAFDKVAAIGELVFHGLEARVELVDTLGLGENDAI